MSLMSRARRVLRRLLARASDRSRDGPGLPVRYADEARLFLLANPGVTALDWEAFALSLAAAAYRDGFDAGERERLDLPPIALLHPADAEARERSLREVAGLRELLDGDGDGDALRGLPLEERALAAANLGRMVGAWRVVPEDDFLRRQT